MVKKNNKKTITKIITVLSGIAFLGFSVSMMIKAMLNPPPSPESIQNSQQISQEESLKKDLLFEGGCSMLLIKWWYFL